MPVVVSDDFNRANSVGLGPNWGNVTSGAGSYATLLVTNNAGTPSYGGGSGMQMYTAGVGEDTQQFSEITFKSMFGNHTSGIVGGPAVLLHNDTAFHSGVVSTVGRTGLRVLSFFNFGFTQLGEYLGSITNSSVVRLTSTTTHLIVHVDGTQVLSIAAGPFNAGRPGMYMSSPSSAFPVEAESWQASVGAPIIDKQIVALRAEARGIKRIHLP